MAKVSGQIIRSFLHTYVCLGYSLDHLNDELSFNLDDFSDPDKRVECQVIGEMKEAALRLTNDPRIFLYEGKFFNPANIGFLGYLIINSPTFRIGAKKVIEYQEIIGDGVRHEFIEESDGNADFVLTMVDDYLIENPRHVVESISSVKAYFIKQIIGHDAKPLEMHFTYPEPDYLDLYHEIFDCPLYFNSDRNSMLISGLYLDQELKMSNPDLCALFEREIKRQLSALESEASLVNEINDILFRLKASNDFSIEAVAGELNIGVRTLQRRLKEENISYNEVLQKFKKTIAENYIKQNNFSISEIAYMLGFSEPSAFHRFFKKWTGKTPKEYRLYSLSG